MKTIHDYLRQGLDIEEADWALKQLEYPQMVYNLTGSQKAAFVGEILRSRSALILTYSEEQARKWQRDLRTWLPYEEILLFPPTEWLPFEVLGRSREITAERIRVLDRLAEDNTLTVVAPVLAVERRLFPPEKWRGHILEFKSGGHYALPGVLAQLVAGGYERVEVVEGRGQFALRGGILDIAPLSGDAVRLEFFDDEVDSLRTFDIESQKSIAAQAEVRVPPVLEYILTKEETEHLRWEVKAQARRASGRLQRLGKPDAADRILEKAAHIETRLEQGFVDENVYPFLGMGQEELVTFFSYLSSDRLVVLDEPLRIKEQLDFQERERMEEFTRQLEHGDAFFNPEKQFLDYEDIMRLGSDRPIVGLSTLLREAPGLTPKRVFNLSARPLTGFMGKTRMLVDEIGRWKSQGNVIALFAGDQEHGSRLLQGLKDLGVTAYRRGLSDPVEGGNVYVYPFSIDHGFELPLGKLVILTELEIYKRERKGPGTAPKPAAPKKSAPKVLLADLKPGDYVVHVQHGIGQFVGIERLTIGGVEKDYFTVRYAGEDRLYIPLDQLHLLQKYLGSEGDSVPKLYKLGGNEWHKVKSKARSAVKELAFDLVKLYAQREATKGFGFGPDNVWQREFEEKFPYQETPDQLQCIVEVKEDMMRSRPMDRLLCGDVGYGKTEVALRAVFKAVMDSKQVAVLVPTTILAQQHFNTFRERFMGYPVTIEMLSRFRSAKEQKAIMGGLKTGSIDVVVGTHRLISDQVKFKDLGLLIIDEEQRFGVAHKEKLKSLKANVDVLTLSATPIPRTLHMSMIGVRDMSVIETPPEDRYPVQTYVAEFRPELVREAMRREIQRGGQVFYVHNRVEDMDQVSYFLRELVPEARYGIAHGQMNEVALEREMLAFLEGETDVLIATTIIESGLDMPNVNTLIVDESDRLGLAQLYQIRGRVGRSNRKAFAYFLYKPQKVLSEVAEKRLAAIREFTEFGSGFKIAMRDLEIRGAGNIIGAQQHGHVAAVGFDLYVQMLREAVAEIRGETVEARVEPSIELRVDAFLPDDYIGDAGLKASLYQRMAQIQDENALAEMLDELIDRFGTPPREVENLLHIVRLKWLAGELKIEQIQQNKQQVTLRFAADPGLSGEKLMQVASNCRYPLAFGTSADGRLECKVRVRILDQTQLLKAVRETLTTFFDIAERPSA
ncbi:transcription-repair-coupling factor [Peptococcaceae bacterium CEB3]|nr:transcription-repair-coupling factor [Peptococcaceae bacterium CEB3]